VNASRTGFRLASDRALEPVDAMTHIVTQPMNGRIIPWSGGGGTVGLSAIFAFAGEHASMLPGALPPLIDPGHAWSLQGLAEVAAVSRSKFACRFKEKVGVSAMEYLTRWRMLRAVIPAAL
jgi:AraC-like DNA-binding protein